MRPLPEPLGPGQQPGFKIRGIKGLAWTPDQYLEEIPVLAKYKMNFLMNCYLSLFNETGKRYDTWWPAGKNEWWLPLPAAKKRAFEEIVRACQSHDIQFCFCLNPNLAATRFCRADNPQDIADLWQHYAWAQSLGVQWFSICLDDIGQGVDGEMHARMVNDIFRRLARKDPAAEMIFCPVYTGAMAPRQEGPNVQRRPGPATAPRRLSVLDGDQVLSPEVTRRSAAAFKAVVKHRIILWDNYPCNTIPVLHLGRWPVAQPTCARWSMVT